MSPKNSSAMDNELEAVPTARTTRLQRALAEAMKIQEGPELLARITNREFRDAFQAIAVQQRGLESYDIASIPTIAMVQDPAHIHDKTKQLYECKLGSGVLTPESGKALKSAAAQRNIQFTHKGEFNNDHWFKATTVTIQAAALPEIIALINDVLIETTRPDARVSYEDIIRVAHEELGKVLK